MTAQAAIALHNSVVPFRDPLRNAILSADEFSLRGPNDTVLHCRWIENERHRRDANRFEVLWPSQGSANQTGLYDFHADRFSLEGDIRWNCTSRNVFKIGRDWIWDHTRERLMLDSLPTE